MFMFGPGSLSDAGTVQCDTKGLLAAIQRNQANDVERILGGHCFSIDELARCLHAACNIGNAECVRLILAQNYLPTGVADIHDSTGITPLIIAAKRGHSDVLRALLTYKCKTDKSTFKIRATALHWAASQGHTECVGLLVDAGADVECHTANKRTPLMMAARAGHPSIVSMLIDVGANAKDVDSEGATALHLAAEEGNEMCTRILLRAESDINKINKHGFTPLIQAARKGHGETLGLLLRRCGFELDLSVRCRQLNALHWAAEGGDAGCVSRLLQHGMEPNEATAKGHVDSQYVFIGGSTPLMIAAKRNHHEACSTLLKYGADPDVVDKEGMTALLYAAKLNLPFVAEALINGGANPNGIEPELHSPAPPAEDDITGSQYDSSSRTDDPGQAGGRSVEDILLDNVIAVSVFNMALNDELDMDDIEELEELETPVTSPLFMAIDRENIQVLKVLLRSNAIINIVELSTLGPMTPLELAIAHGNVTICKMLITAGFNASFYIANAPVLEETLANFATTNPDFFNLLVEFLRSPPKLTQLARNAVRQSMGRAGVYNYTELPVPIIIQKFINLSEFEDPVF